MDKSLSGRRKGIVRKTKFRKIFDILNYQERYFRIGILENEKLEGWKRICELEKMLNQAETFTVTDDYRYII